MMKDACRWNRCVLSPWGTVASKILQAGAAAAKKTAYELRCDAEMGECLEDDVARGTEHRNVQNRLPSVLTTVKETTRGRRTGRDRVQEDSTSDRDQILNSRLLYR